jgi:hypothetical protein
VETILKARRKRSSRKWFGWYYFFNF